MALADQPDAYLAEQLRVALALDPQLHELGIHVTVAAARRRAVLVGVVPTRERRERAGEIARRVLPEFEIQNDVTVQQLVPPDPETFA
jgi:osmotically-inducible protein OsmY